MHVGEPDGRTRQHRVRGVGDDCAVASLDDLALGYATALFLREETGPHSLVNRAGSNPSIVDGLEVPLLSVPEPSKSLQGGGSATIPHWQPRERRVRTPGPAPKRSSPPLRCLFPIR